MERFEYDQLDQPEVSWRSKIVIIVYSVMALFAILAFIIGYVLFSYSGIPEVIDGYQEGNCTLTNSTVVPLEDCDMRCVRTACGYHTEYLPVYRDRAGRTVTLSPWAAQVEPEYARTALEKYDIGRTYPCLCNAEFSPRYPNVTGLKDCEVWGVCQLDVKRIGKLRGKSQYFLQAGNVLGWLGFGTMIALVLFAIVIAVYFNRNPQ